MKFVPKKISRGFGRKALQTKKNSPHIFFALGIVGVVGGTVLACRATLKLEENLDEIKKDLNATKELESNYPSEKAYMKDLGYVYGKSAFSMVKLYGPAFAVGGAGIACLTGSHVQLTRRNTALTATLVAVSKAYEEYRAKVKEVIGEKKELDIYQSVSDEVAGQEYQKKVNGIPFSPYSRFFDESNVNYQKDSEMNRIFLTCQLNYVNYLLQARGHVFLNDVYDMLGMERSTAGAVVGWVRDGKGDGYIDFGLLEPSSRRFVNQLEPAIFLDFNVDGVVYDLIEKG